MKVQYYWDERYPTLYLDIPPTPEAWSYDIPDNLYLEWQVAKKALAGVELEIASKLPLIDMPNKLQASVEHTAKLKQMLLNELETLKCKSLLT